MEEWGALAQSRKKKWVSSLLLDVFFVAVEATRQERYEGRGVVVKKRGGGRNGRYEEKREKGKQIDPV